MAFRSVFKSAFAGLTVAAFTIGVLTLGLVTLLYPPFRKLWQDARAVMASVLPLAIVVPFLVRGLRRAIRAERGVVSRGLALWLGEEWMIAMLVWIVVAFEVVVCSFWVPIYALGVRVQPDTTVTSADVSVVALPDSVPFARGTGADTLVFWSPRVFVWGDTNIAVLVHADGLSKQVPVRWSGLAPLHVFRGYRLSPVPLHLPHVMLAVTVHPSDAVIAVRGNGSYREFPGSQRISVPAEVPITVTVSAANRQPYEEVLSLTADTTINVTLPLLRGRLRVQPHNAAGAFQAGMELFIDGVSRGENREIDLPAGSYTVYLKQTLSARVLIVDSFEVVIRPGRLTDKAVEVRAEAP